MLNTPSRGIGIGQSALRIVCRSRVSSLPVRRAHLRELTPGGDDRTSLCTRLMSSPQLCKIRRKPCRSILARCRHSPIFRVHSTCVTSGCWHRTRGNGSHRAGPSSCCFPFVTRRSTLSFAHRRICLGNLAVSPSNGHSRGTVPCPIGSFGPGTTVPGSANLARYGHGTTSVSGSSSVRGMTWHLDRGLDYRSGPNLEHCGVSTGMAGFGVAQSSSSRAISTRNRSPPHSPGTCPGDGVRISVLWPCATSSSPSNSQSWPSPD